MASFWDKEHDISDMSDPLVQYMYELIDHVILGVCFEVHRSIRLGTFELEDIDNQGQREFEIVEKPGVDVFGQPPMKKSMECVCPNCQRNMAANRFAPHLEKCMGMGRNSSRIASRRIATTGKLEEFDVDDDFDNDWTYEFEKKGRKIKKEKISNSPRGRAKNSKKDNNANTNNNSNNNNNGGGGGGSRPGTPCSTASGDISNNVKAGPTLQALESLSQVEVTLVFPAVISSLVSSGISGSYSSEEKVALLRQTCGAISEHTGKMCTRTGRCVQHTDQQRLAVRDRLLGDIDDMPLPPSMRPEGPPLDQDDIHVDVDGYEDIDAAPLLRDLNQIAWEESSNLSNSSDTIPSIPIVTKHPKKTKSGRKGKNR